MERFRRWIRQHVPASIAVVILCVILPLVAFFVILFMGDTGVPRIIIEGLIGSWPTQKLSTGGTAVSVGLSTLVVFGIPSAIGLILQALIDKAEEIRVDVRQYLVDRDQFLGGAVSGTLRNWLKEHEGKVNEENEDEFGDAVREAIRQASRAWAQGTQGTDVTVDSTILPHE
jgi:hypothetical protein